MCSILRTLTKFWVSGGVRPKRRQGVKSAHFFGFMLGANMSSKILFYVARRAQDPSGEGPGGIFLETKFELNIEGS